MATQLGTIVRRMGDWCRWLFRKKIMQKPLILFFWLQDYRGG
jgi:hypothetical protein